MDLAVNVAFPAITAAFALETRAIRWVVVCYVLTYSGLMLAFGKLGDRVGYRPLFRAGLIVSAVSFVACALAPDYATLLVARIGQGVGTALVMSCAPALATLLFDESRRVDAFGAYTGLTAVGSVVAPLVGGASIVLLDWSGVFWFRAPIAVLALALLPLLPQVDQARSSIPRERDGWVSALLLAGSMTLLLLPVTLVGMDVAAWPALAAAFGGVALMFAFVQRERRAPEPFFPRPTVPARRFVYANLTGAAVYFAAFAIPLLVPYYLARSAGLSPFEIGAVLAASPIGIAIGSAFAPRIVRARDAQWLALLGGMLVALGSFSISLWNGSSALVVVVGTLAMHGLGLGLFQVAYGDIVLAALPREDRGVAGSLTMVVRTIGVVVAAALLTSALHTLERANSAAGRAPLAAWVDAFSTIFLGLGLTLAAFFLFRGLDRMIQARK